ncbi:MAG: CotH kinase family protein, partial [Clostridiales bacterium]|nr:CotH kinase family protein [Clostridiales bacterium]
MKRILVLAFSISILTGAFFWLNAYPVDLVLPEDMNAADLAQEGLTIWFSEDSHFFPTGVAVEIFSNSAAEIHYTLDGAEPTIASARFSEPLVFTTRQHMDVIVLRAIAVFEEEITEPLTHTFFIGSGVDERFDVMVFSLSTNPEHLYDHVTGILVDGIIREEYLAENPGARIDPTVPANFNQSGPESERPIYVEAFLPNGERILSQAAGVRVSGAWSRAERVKSLRLIARREYSPDAGRFHFEFFPGDVIQDGFATPLQEYNTLILRNGGNDRHHGILTNELSSVIARRADFIAATPVRAAALFINGEYKGYVWLQTRFDEHYLQELFNTPTREFDVVERGEWWFRNATEEQELALTYKNEYAFLDLTDDAIFAELESIVDIDNLLFYYAFQIWLGNGDWPHNNLRRWRYT